MAAIKKYNGSTWETTTARKYETATETIQSGDTIYADGTAATVSLKGNTVQNGTPTPSNPVDVVGVGERTANLWNEVYPDISSTVQYIPLYVGSGNFTLSSDAPLNTSNGRDLFFLAGNVSSGANSGQNGVSSDQKKTVTAVDGYVTVAYRTLGGASPDIRDYHSMLNSGSRAKPYEPYGYKIPISINNNTTNIYIGDNPLRKSLDGTAYDTLAADGTLTRRVDSDGSVLVTPVVSQITMPSFNTIDGANTITVDTTVQPSEVSATYTGWHDSSVKEWDGSDWQ